MSAYGLDAVKPGTLQTYFLFSGRRINAFVHVLDKPPSKSFFLCQRLEIPGRIRLIVPLNVQDLTSQPFIQFRDGKIQTGIQSAYKLNTQDGI